MRYFRPILVSLAFSLLFCIAAPAQETQTRVVDEVVAAVNEGVITLSRIKRESKMIFDSFREQGKSPEEAQKLVDEKQGEIIANMINEELLVQRAKELGLANDIEASVNQRQAEIMKQYNIKTVEALYTEMERQGINPKDLLDNWRKQTTRDMVIQREVQAKVYWEPNGKQLKEYYEKNKAKFATPEAVSFSELFLGFEGKDPAAVREKAKQLHTQLKAGADFAKIAKDNGDPGLVTQGTGKAEKIPVKELHEKIAPSLKDVKPNEFTAPIELEQFGVVILRVDARQAASNESTFDERAVRLAMMQERFPVEQKKFMAKLREDALIKIGDRYRPLVAPVLFAEERKEKTNN